MAPLCLRPHPPSASRDDGGEVQAPHDQATLQGGERTGRRGKPRWIPPRIAHLLLLPRSATLLIAPRYARAHALRHRDVPLDRQRCDTCVGRRRLPCDAGRRASGIVAPMGRGWKWPRRWWWRCDRQWRRRRNWNWGRWWWNWGGRWTPITWLWRRPRWTGVSCLILLISSSFVHVTILIELFTL